MTVQPPPIPSRGVTIEWKDSTAYAFGEVMELARQHPSFQQLAGKKGKPLYRLTCEPADADTLLKLTGLMCGWKSQRLYVDGTPRTWKLAVEPLRCYARRQRTYKPGQYCYGAWSQCAMPNIWGCNQLNMPFIVGGGWFGFGDVVRTKQGTGWRFDKDHLRHELCNRAESCRLCPAFDMHRALDGLAAMPDKVWPDNDWRFAAGPDYFGGTRPADPVAWTGDECQEREEPVVPIAGVNPDVAALKKIAQKLSNEDGRWYLLTLCNSYQPPD